LTQDRSASEDISAGSTALGGNRGFCRGYLLAELVTELLRVGLPPPSPRSRSAVKVSASVIAIALPLP
jgi:hypothetical protein